MEGFRRIWFKGLYVVGFFFWPDLFHRCCGSFVMFWTYQKGIMNNECQLDVSWLCIWTKCHMLHPTSNSTWVFKRLRPQKQRERERERERELNQLFTSVLESTNCEALLCTSWSLTNFDTLETFCWTITFLENTTAFTRIRHLVHCCRSAFSYLAPTMTTPSEGPEGQKAINRTLKHSFGGVGTYFFQPLQSSSWILVLVVVWVEYL